MTTTESVDAQDARASALPPILVPIKEASRLTGRVVSRVYEMIANGELTARKDGKRTMVEYESIVARSKRLPVAKIKPDVRNAKRAQRRKAR